MVPEVDVPVAAYITAFLVATGGVVYGLLGVHFLFATIFRGLGWAKDSM